MANKSTRSVQVPVEVKLEVANQASVMKDLLRDLQDTFGGVDLSSSLGKNLNKAFNQITKKLGTIDGYLGKELFAEGDLIKTANLSEQIAVCFRDIERYVKSTSVKNFALSDADLRRIEQAETALENIYKTKAADRSKGIGAVLKAGDADLKRFTSRQKETGFDSTKTFGANKKALEKTAITLGQSVDTLDEAFSQAQNSVDSFTEILNKAKAEVTAARNKRDQKAQQLAHITSQNEYHRVGQELKGVKTHGVKKDEAIKSFQDVLDKQLDASGNFIAGGESFAKIFAEWIDLDNIEGLMSQSAQEIVTALKQELANKMREGLSVYTFENKAKGTQQADIAQAQAELLEAERVYNQVSNSVTDAQADLNEAITKRNDAETNLKQAQELLNEVQSQITRLIELREQYEATIEQTYAGQISDARQHVQQVREEVRKPYDDITTRTRTSADTSSGNTRGYADNEYNRNQTNQQREQEAEDFRKSLQEATRHWMSASQIISYIKDGIRQAWQDIQGLDKAMTNIAVVTDMSVSDLWGKINEYMAIAQQYGVTTQGVYEVSQLYYQQGLSTNEVMAATTETLKLARIAGMDYAEAADAMTVAIRSFKMEMSDAQRVTDVYSKVAAITASDSEELAVAMSKTASSAESVGSSFENTTAMLAVMVETTRESAQNLGSALKSIISRYGEMKTGVTIDSEGEAIDYNKVDTALQSIGISLKDAQGQFRDFDDVIFELSASWDSLDKNTQRYIATIMAGNRQQSRFIALVDNWERLDEVSKAATDADDAGLLQYAKTMDSLETKINTVSNSFQQFYMSAFNGDFFKGALDIINNIITSLSKVGPLLGGIQLIQLITQIKNIGSLILNGLSGGISKIKSASEAWKNEFTNAGWEPVGERIGQIIANGIASKAALAAQQAVEQGKAQTQDIDTLVGNITNNDLLRAQAIYDKKDGASKEEIQLADSITQATADLKKNLSEASESQRKAAIETYTKSIESANKLYEGAKKGGEAIEKSGKNFWTKTKEFGKQHSQSISKGLYAVGTGLSMYGMTMDQTDYDSYNKSTRFQLGGSVATGVGQFLTGDKIGGIITLITGAVTAIKRISQLDEVRLESLTKKSEEANIERAKKREEARNLQSTIDNLKKLQAARYKSEEAEQAFIEASNTAAEQFPGLIQGYDETGNAIIDVITETENAEKLLIQARKAAAKATIEASAAEYQKNVVNQQQAEEKASEQERVINDIIKDYLNSTGISSGINNDVEAILNQLGVTTRDAEGKLLGSFAGFDFSSNSGLEALKKVYELVSSNREFQFWGKENGYSFDNEIINSNELLKKHFEEWISYRFGDSLGLDENHRSIFDIFGAIEGIQQPVIQAQSATEASRQAYIKGFIDEKSMLLDTDKAYETILGLKDIIFNNIYDDIANNAEEYFNIDQTLNAAGQNLINTEIQDQLDSINQAFDEKRVGTGYIDAYNEFLNSIKTGSLSFNQIQEEFAKRITKAQDSGNQELVDILTQQNATINEGLVLRQQNILNYLKSTVPDISDAWDAITLDDIDAQYFDELSIYAEAIQDKLKSGAINSDNGRQLIEKFIALYNNVKGFSEAEQALFAAVTDGSIFTTSGQAVLEQTLNQLTDGKVSTVEIPVYAENLVTAYAQLQQTVADGLQTLTETIDGAIDGVDITKATAISQKTGQSINKLFNYSDGKYSIKDSAAFEAIANAYYSEIDAQITAVGEETTRQLGLLQGYENKTLKEGEDDYLEAKQLHERLKPLADEVNLTVQQYLEKVQNDSVAALIAQKDAWTKETQLALDIRDLARGDRTEYEMQAAQILASTGGLGLSEEDVKTIALALGKDINWIKDQLILNSDGTFDISNLYRFDLLNIGQDATNSAMVKRAVEKSNLADNIEDSLVGMYDNIAEVSLEDLTTLYKDITKKDADATQLGKFQKALDEARNGSYVSLTEVVNELRQAAEDAGIDVDTSLIEATIKDAQLALVASVLSVLDSGLTGDLGFVEYNEFLRNNLHINASEGSEEWARWQKYVYETNDGLKFTNAGVSAIYAELGKIAPMAQQAFVETVADGQKQYETLGSTLEYIEELKENINKAESKADDTKRKQYEAELEIAQKIFEIRSEDPDQFNFMSRDIRDGIQAPTNMWENAGQAAEVLRQATTDGYMAAEDFWRMAETTNEYLSLSGKEFTLGMDSYAEAMEAAAKHTKVVGDELVIDFGAMGLNIETAMGDMASGLDEGIKAMAEEQIKLLDAQISMLEGFQALEELSGEEIFADGIEVGELFKNDELTDMGKSFVDQIKEILEQILGESFKSDEFDAMLKGNQQLATDFLNSWVEFLATGETSPQAMEAFVRKWMLDYSEAYKNEVPAAPEPEYTSLQDKREADLKSGRVIEEGFSGKALNKNPDIETTDTIALKSISNDVSSIAASMEAKKGKELASVEENGIAISKNTGKIITLLEEQEGEEPSSVDAKKRAADEYFSEDEAYWNAMRADLDAEQQAKADSYREFGAQYKYEESRQEATQLSRELREVSGAADESSTALAELVQLEGDLSLATVAATGTIEQRADAYKAAAESERERIELLKDLNDITDEPVDPVDVQVDYSEVNAAISAVDTLLSKDNSTATLTVDVKQNGSTNPRGGVEAALKPKHTVQAKGNVALAGGRGTLMGELGPELYVQNGHYYIAGAHGAEFVDLADDAIVFNHLQTRRIMGAGSINGRGTPVVSESKSVSFAAGNADGRAMAIGDVINKLKQQREMWQSIIDNMSVSEMVGGGGSGGGGGGGSGNSIKAVTEELQEWYNLSRQISDIEQEINNIIAERENIADGGKYLKSLREQEKLLNEQSRTQEVLLRYQQLQLQRQADFINQNKIWSQFLEVDENGLLQYIEGNETNGGKGALKVLQELNDMSGEQQLAFLQKLGYSYTDNDGNALEGEDLIQMFFEELQSQIDQYDNLYDTVHETESTLEELESSIKEINEEIKQNQMDLEEAIYDIIVNSWEAEISQMEKQAELIKEANEEYIDGLNEALSAERDMYKENDSIAEREQLQRRLSLLRRSGGSASEIANLEQQLDDMLRDEYFNKQEQMIENIQNANEEQVRLLEQQITMQEEALQYQKENGVIWTKVYEVMSGTEAEILEFMQGNYVEFFAQSLLQQETMLTDWAKKIGIYNEDKVYNRHADYARKQIWDTEGIWSQGGLAEYRSVYDSLTAEQKANLRETHASTYASTMMESEDFDTASAAATQVVYEYLKQIKAQQDATQTQPPTTTPSTGGSSGSTSSSTDVTHWTFTYNGTKYYHYKDKASAEKRLKELYQNDYSKAEMNDDLAGMTLAGQRYSNALRTLKSGLHSKGYSTGGLVDYTGTAIVHGSKSRPEAFLNAEQTAQIRDALKNSGKDNVLDNIRTAVWQLKEHFASLTTKNNNEYNVSIAPGAVVIQVEQLNDAYDIEEISNDVMNRMTTIAAKATNRGVNRR